MVLNAPAPKVNHRGSEPVGPAITVSVDEMAILQGLEGLETMDVFEIGGEAVATAADVAPVPDLAMATRDSCSPVPASGQPGLQARADDEIAWAILHKEEVFQAYAALEETSGGRLLNDELFKALLPVVYEDPSRAHRLDFKGIEVLLKDYFNSRMQRPREGEANSVVVIAGGAGAGKTTHARYLLANHAEQIDSVVDLGATSWEAVQACMGAALRAGRHLDLLYIGGDPEGSVNRTVARALVDGRVVPATQQAEINRAAAQQVATAIRAYPREEMGVQGFDVRRGAYTYDPKQLVEADLASPACSEEGVERLLEHALVANSVGGSLRESFLRRT